MKKQNYLKLWVSLVNTRDAISKLRERELKKFHVSAAQSGVLSVLYYAKENLTPAEISRRSFRDPSSVTVILNRMVTKGLIKKLKDKKRKNLKRIALTAKGRDLYTRIIEEMCIYGLFSTLSGEQCQQLGECLNVLLSGAAGRLNGPSEIAGKTTDL